MAVNYSWQFAGAALLAPSLLDVDALLSEVGIDLRRLSSPSLESDRPPVMELFSPNAGCRLSASIVPRTKSQIVQVDLDPKRGVSCL